MVLVTETSLCPLYAVKVKRVVRHRFGLVPGGSLLVIAVRNHSLHTAQLAGAREPPSATLLLHPHPRPVLHRLGHVIGHDHLAARQVCDRAGELQDTVIGAG
jgi:hypothetical protein